ncbi:MAG: hypothetical protein ACYCPM_06150 [Acidobacteriaceae bacterium]
MNLDLLLLLGLYFFVAFIAAAFFLQRYRWRRRRRLNKSNWGFYPSAASMGNALQGLQAIAQPQIQHIIEEKLDEDVDEDDAGGSKDPTAHLHRQAARIRRGTKLEGITAQLRATSVSDGESAMGRDPVVALRSEP